MTKLVFLDTETTGLNPDRCKVWEIGAIHRTADGDIEYAWQIRPDLTDAEPNGLRIGRYYERSRIIRADIGEAWKTVHPDFGPHDSDREPMRWTRAAAVADELAQMLDGAYVIGAVPWFDERFLQRFLTEHGQAATNHYHLIDVETLAAGQMQLSPPWRFDDILADYGLTYNETDRHTALGDARMARDLFDAIMSSDSKLPGPAAHEDPDPGMPVTNRCAYCSEAIALVGGTWYHDSPHDGPPRDGHQATPANLTAPA